MTIVHLLPQRAATFTGLTATSKTGWAEFRATYERAFWLGAAGGRLLKKYGLLVRASAHNWGGIVLEGGFAAMLLVGSPLWPF
jgi:hypothetical protein